MNGNIFTVACSPAEKWRNGVRKAHSGFFVVKESHIPSNVQITDSDDWSDETHR